MATPTVEEYLATLVHAHRDAVLRLREIVRTALPELSESVKWNAPSYSAGGVHLVTFRLHPKDQLQLVLHRGSRPGGEAAFDDPTGLVVRAGPDRGVVTFAGLPDVEAKADALTHLLRAWCATPPA